MGILYGDFTNIFSLAEALPPPPLSSHCKISDHQGMKIVWPHMKNRIEIKWNFFVLGIWKLLCILNFLQKIYLKLALLKPLFFSVSLLGWSLLDSEPGYALLPSTLLTISPFIWKSRDRRKWSLFTLDILPYIYIVDWLSHGSWVHHTTKL